MVSSIVILIICLVGFAAIHSLLASLPFKRFIRRSLGSRADELYMPVYNLIAVITIIPLVYLLYKNPGEFLYIVPSPWRWLMVGGQVIALIVGPRALRDAPHRFQLKAQLSAPNSPDSIHLNIHGVYRWIRDPFLLSGLVIMWLTPFMTTNLLIIYILTTIYLIMGSIHWESRLVAQFGDEYRDYQKHVHRIIPRLKAYYDK
ncbi:isoprenylcysteine carboxylmethyltransferase family protein [Methanolobus sediminis]|uniref:Isoprenylcysteine carboxylmethyltransferase family protein n=1 Tax=Methanolobus sediminis TaxID=3072978 RepID=A0AA51UK55_9EURY|nr:isoprenylcysteine carboxylmethyltransferase family protein [Methanolobus sediminis]WMW25073.1 isoprenylcysteine carboxylmethyltransferase family protein [Methanolobus sediminis]